MQALKKRIEKDGRIVSDTILSVDSFLNHQLDVGLITQMAKTWQERFKNPGITKILTAEASGIALAVVCGLVFEKPVIFAKKKPCDVEEPLFYQTEVYSFTKKMRYLLSVKKDYLKKDDCVLIIDDFLANGEAAVGLVKLVEQANAKVAGCGFAVEKSFQKGRSLLSSYCPCQIESLVRIKSMDPATNKLEYVEGGQ